MSRTRLLGEYSRSSSSRSGGSRSPAISRGPAVAAHAAWLFLLVAKATSARVTRQRAVDALLNCRTDRFAIRHICGSRAPMARAPGRGLFLARDADEDMGLGRIGNLGERRLGPPLRRVYKAGLHQREPVEEPADIGVTARDQRCGGLA